MRGGKDWTHSTMEPLFPRLHVKDTEKGGPKPPPRNKMAVYDELITPASRSTNESTTMFPLHPNGFGQIRYAGSSGQVGGHRGPDRRTFSALYGSRASTHTTSRIVPSSPSDGTLSNISANSAAKPLGYATSSISGNSLMTTRFSSLQRSNFINFKRPSCNEGKVEVTLPSLARQGESVDSGTKQCGLDQEKRNSKQTSGGNRLKRASVCDQDPEDHAKMTASSVRISARESQGSSKKMTLISTVGANVSSSHESSKSLLSNGVSKCSKNTSTFSSQQSCQTDERSTTPVEEDNVTLKVSDNKQPNVLGNSRASLLRTESYSGNNSLCAEESEDQSMQAEVVHKNENLSGSTEVDPPTSVIISPDDVVLKIGQENFWKIRRTMVNQQRILSIQVFELHRLVQVQRSLSRSSHHFTEESLCFHKVSDKDNSVPAPPPPPPPPLPPPPQLPPLPTHPKTIAADNSVVKIPFPPFLYDSARGSLCGKTTASPIVMANNQGTCFDSPPPPPPPSPPIESNDLPLKKNTAPANSLGKHLFSALSGNSNNHSLIPADPCFYPPPENQWLVPFISPQGLVYKPYAGSSPHPYFLNAAYGIPHSHQAKGMIPGIPITLSYLDPCGLSSTNLPPQGGVEERSCSGITVLGSNEVDRQGSTGSSSVERASQDALPLFPLEPCAAQELESAVPDLENGGGEKQTRAIKAVPRDGRLATESLMRIFQSIQEERRHE